METLVLTSKDKATPFIYQVPKPVYEKFKHYQNTLLVRIHPIISMIDSECSIHQNNLMNSIIKWKTKALKELDIYERREKAEILAGSIFG